MGEGIRYHPALVFFLKHVVADGSRGIKCFLYVTLFNGVEHLACIVGPYTCQKISLQLKPDSKLVASDLAQALTLVLHFIKDPHLVLNMMPYLVRHDISYGEVTVNTIFCTQIIKETEVDVYLFITRAVERSAGGGGIATGRLDLIPEQHQGGLPVCGSRLGEYLAPDLFSVSQHYRDKLSHCVLFFRGLHRTSRFCGARLLQNARRISPEEVNEQHNY